MSKLRIPSAILSQITAHARKELPNECCGYLAAKDGVITSCYEMYNVDQSPEHFSLDPKEQFAVIKQIRERGEQLTAVYHSHPETPARPSQEDIRLAYDPQLSYVICSMENGSGDIKSFKIQNGSVSPEEIVAE